ncbi:unnamed protein product [Heligmosomoides polygyrus]|uniref:RusA family crossover junction endodeoxyribonuclease n=1 Tax=Heligmosomoides polygyrus TaxID=6339 RepID=A0A183GKX2_HELPZ|nr:unnamed protein product [Heligmosomoides polygyrus]
MKPRGGLAIFLKEPKTDSSFDIGLDGLRLRGHDSWAIRRLQGFDSPRPHDRKGTEAHCILIERWTIVNENKDGLPLVRDIVCKTMQKFVKEPQDVRLSITVSFQPRITAELVTHERHAVIDF